MNERNLPSRKSAVSRPLFVPLVICMLGIFVSAAAWRAFRHEEVSALEQKFHVLANERAQLVHEGMKEGFDELDAVRARFETSVEITEAEFALIARHVFHDDAGVRAIGWAPRVPRDQIATYETRIRRQGFSNYEVRPWQAAEGRAPHLDDSFPVRVMAAQDESLDWSGVDLGSAVALADTLQRSIDGGHLETTVLNGGGDTGRSPTVFAFLPVAETDEPAAWADNMTDGVLGVIFAEFDAESFVQNPLALLATVGIDVSLYEVNDGQGPFHVYTRRANASSVAAESIGEDAQSTQGLCDTLDATLGGRTWQVRCAATPAFFDESPSSAPLVALLSGLALTSLLTILAHVLTYRMKVIERTVAKRTLEIAAAQRETEHIAARLKAILHTSADAIITTDERGQIVAANPAVQTVLGYQPQEAIGVNLSELVPSVRGEPPGNDSSADVCAGFDDIVGMRREVEGRHKDGSRVPLDLSLSEVRLDDERFFTAFAHDISESKRAAATLKKLSLVAKNTRHSIIISDANGHIEWVNDAFIQLTGWETDDVGGRRLIDFVYNSETDPETARMVDEKLRRREPVKAEVRNVGKLGRRYWTASKSNRFLMRMAI